MRKQNDSNPPAPEHEGRLINSTIRSAKYKRPNALKRGVYASPTLIPGENRKEFEELLAELLDEYKPLGPSLRHAVHCLADSMWRLRRLKKSVQTELYENTFDPHHPAFDEVWGSAMFIHYLRTEPETCFDKHAKKCLRPDKINNLKQRFPRTNTNQRWNGLKPSQLKSFQVCCRPSPNSRRLNWVTGPTSWSRHCANGEPTNK
jgi:hypothetical protein